MFNGIYNGTIIIAEAKVWSPRGERLTQNSWEQQIESAGKVGRMVSVLTHPIWRRSPDDIKKARKILPSEIKILAKGFYETDDEVQRAVDDGADFVLVVGRRPKVHLERCFLEPLTLAELADIPVSLWAVWNSRDLSSLKDLPGIPQFLLERWKQMDGCSDRKRESFKEARAIRLGPLCQASNLKTVADIEPGANAVLVGSHLESFAASLGITI
ncbi:MAG: hypothetical protein NTY04_03265 [Candidatus Staskawiczbacteria bacterium]|nr:hypothetical protein [Candidatus Staskawiczbacteria bacterium]